MPYSRKVVRLKKIRPTKESGFWRIHQPCLASKAMLKHSRSQYPNPPLSFHHPIRFQLIHAVFFSLSLCPHQNRDIIELMSLHNVLGNRNTLIVYVGIASTTALSKISFPAWERNFSCHQFIRSQIFPFISVKALIRDLPIKAGSPKYFSYHCVEFTPTTATI
jgi:hypothetical protein